MKKVSRGGSQEFWGILYHRRQHIYKPSYRLGTENKTHSNLRDHQLQCSLSLRVQVSGADRYSSVVPSLIY